MRILALAVVALFLGAAFGQPESLTLRAKLRDFKDFRPGDSTTHPDFENDAYMDCGGMNLGYVRDTLGTDGAVDTAQFRGDERGPILARLNHPTSGKPCFTGFTQFRDWYNDNPAKNRSFYIDLVLTRNIQGLYAFDDDNFLPLNAGGGFMKFRPTDPDPFGPRPEVNPVDVWGFTLELHTTFTYLAGTGQAFTFKGDDDVWVFINGRLVIDLGGLHPSLTATVNLDARAAALGLVDGNSYPLDFFFAERHSTASRLQITTSLQLAQRTALPLPVATPPGQSFRDSLRVALSVPGHPDAQIRYTLDGSEPTGTSPVYAASLLLTSTTTLKAMAFKADFLPSATRTENYVRELVALPTPVATPPGQVFRTSIEVGVTVPGHPDAQIRYTLDGSEPTELSPLIAADLRFATTTTLTAKAFKPGFLPSPVRVENYVLELLKLPAPVANPPGSDFQASLQVALTVPGQPDALIRYTLDGSDPDASAPPYAGPLTLTSGVTVKARAFLPGWLPSDVMVESYTLVVPPNAITLKMDTAVHRSDGQAVILTGMQNPIAIVSVDAGLPRCLACPPEARDVVLQPGRFPEWTAVSRDPFRYVVQIYDHIGQFVTSQTGKVTREMLELAPGDTAGYRVLRFRWIPSTREGRVIGTGAYILRAKVMSDPPTVPGVKFEPTEAALLTTFGFLRSD